MAVIFVAFQTCMHKCLEDISSCGGTWVYIYKIYSIQFNYHAYIVTNSFTCNACMPHTFHTTDAILANFCAQSMLQ